MLIKEDAGWGRASFEGKSFNSVHWFLCEGCFKGSPVIKYAYLGCFKVLWFDFAIYVLFIFMAYWKEASSGPCQTSEGKLFAKLINSWKQLIFFTKNSVLDIWKDSEFSSVE